MPFIDSKVSVTISPEQEAELVKTSGSGNFHYSGKKRKLADDRI